MQPFDTVKAFFVGLSSGDGQRIRTCLAQDFQLLEQGEVWDAARLIEAVAGAGARRNFFCLLRQQIQGDMAWVSYWNRALIARSDDERKIAWLESAVLLLHDGEWKLQMLHSTRVNEDALPAGIVLLEHITD